ncbi:MAG TPA: phage antirepressor [Barnesiella intestinihominis]|jgi:prophage antirepressor-like protein|uniref:phage antirepressor n=1 Tax=Barnesiella intestinihominis TaxID=487174 RepID=UPI000EE16F1B|nr:phage antirepressor KilAC domain-containing protein [Barnesiella intestinihominis]HCP43584.1 phage antirepressor [Barnesiella intestinihominis]
MAAQIQVLKQTELLGHQFTVYGTAENPMFLAREIAECIDYDKTSLNKLVASVDDDEKGRNIIPTPGGNQQVWFLTEGGLYEVLMQSRKPIAKQFKKGVKQILHEVRTTGGYISTKQEDTPEEIMARALTIAQATLAKREERLKQLEVENAQKQIIIERKDEEISIKDDTIKVLAPKGKCYDEIMSSEGLVTTNMIAAFLGVSAIKLNKLLCEWGVQYRQSSVYFLTAKYRSKGFTKHVPYPYMDNGVQKSREHMYWTESGRKFVIELFNTKLSA